MARRRQWGVERAFIATATDREWHYAIVRTQSIRKPGAGTNPSPILEGLVALVEHSRWADEVGDFERLVREDLGTTPDLLAQVVGMHHERESEDQGLKLRLKHMRTEITRQLDALDPLRPEAGRPPDNPDNVRISPQEPEYGNSESYTRRLLARDHPALYERVLTKEISANAAAIEAGIRTKTITVPLDPAKAAATLRRAFNDEDLGQLVRLLQA